MTAEDVAATAGKAVLVGGSAGALSANLGVPLGPAAGIGGIAAAASIAGDLVGLGAAKLRRSTQKEAHYLRVAVIQYLAFLFDNIRRGKSGADFLEKAVKVLQGYKQDASRVDDEEMIVCLYRAESIMIRADHRGALPDGSDVAELDAIAMQLQYEHEYKTTHKRGFDTFISRRKNRKKEADLR